MAQHTDPGAIPIGARPLPIEVHEKSSQSDEHESFLASKAMLSSSTTDAYDENAVTTAAATTALRDSVHGNNHANNLENPTTKGTTANTNSGHLMSSDANGSGSGTTNGSNHRGRKVERKRGVRRCRKCGNNYKPPRAHHDSVTGRCISKFDHFCPWVGNAVGALNHKFFVLFIFYTFLASLISLFLLVIRFIRCGFTIDNDDDDSLGINDPSGNINMTTTEMSWSQAGNSSETFKKEQLMGHGYNNDTPHHQTIFLFQGCEGIYSTRVLFLLVMSICFLVFTCCMLFEQIDAIESNTSKIARMKLRMGQDTNGEYEKVANGFNEMFGVGFGGQGSRVAIHWFLPTPVRFPDDAERDRVLGYEYFSIWDGKIYQEDEDNADEADDYDEEVQSSASTIRKINSTLRRGRKGASALMLSESDHEGDVTLEIELSAGIGLGLEGSKGSGSRTISRRSSGKSKLESNSSEHSNQIV